MNKILEDIKRILSTNDVFIFLSCNSKHIVSHSRGDAITGLGLVTYIHDELTEAISRQRNNKINQPVNPAQGE